MPKPEPVKPLLDFTSEKREQTSLVEITGTRMVEVLRDAGLEIPEDFVVKIATNDGSCTLDDGPCIIYVMKIESSGQFDDDNSPPLYSVDEADVAAEVNKRTEDQLHNLAAAKAGPTASTAPQSQGAAT